MTRSKQTPEHRRKIGIAVSKWRREHRDLISGENAPHKTPHTEAAKQKMREAKLGRKDSEKTRQRKSEARKRYLANNPEANRGKNHPMFGRHLSEETKRKMRKAKKGKSAEEIYTDPEAYRKQRSEKQKELWKDPAYRKSQLKKQFKGRQVHPNKLERFLSELLQELFPNEYKFVGDGTVIIGGKLPDFINVNGQKKIIEFFGNYYHKREDEEIRIAYFRRYGYKTLVIWEEELNDLPKLKNKLFRFHRS